MCQGRGKRQGSNQNLRSDRVTSEQRCEARSPIVIHQILTSLVTRNFLRRGRCSRRVLSAISQICVMHMNTDYPFGPARAFYSQRSIQPHSTLLKVTQPHGLSYIHGSNLIHYLRSMSHDGNPFNFTRLMFTEVPTNYSYGPTYNPLPPGIGSEISIHPNGLQSESWLTGSVSSAVTPSLCQSPRYREIRPRPAPTSPQPEIKKNISQPVGMHTENTRRTVSGVAGRTNQPARRNEARSAWLASPPFVTLAN